MCDFSRVSAWFCDEKISLKKSCFYLYIRRRYVYYRTKTTAKILSCGNILGRSFELLSELQPDGYLVLGDTNSCLSAISAKRLHIPLFHMEAGNRCKDECLPEETNRRIVKQVLCFLLLFRPHWQDVLETVNMVEAKRPEKNYFSNMEKRPEHRCMYIVL